MTQRSRPDPAKKQDPAGFVQQPPAMPNGLLRWEPRSSYAGDMRNQPPRAPYERQTTSFKASETGPLERARAEGISALAV